VTWALIACVVVLAGATVRRTSRRATRHPWRAVATIGGMGALGALLAGAAGDWSDWPIGVVVALAANEAAPWGARLIRAVIEHRANGGKR
jgi:uncharacterized membrane protein YfcA